MGIARRAVLSKSSVPRYSRPGCQHGICAKRVNPGNCPCPALTCPTNSPPDEPAGMDSAPARKDRSGGTTRPHPLACTNNSSTIMHDQRDRVGVRHHPSSELAGEALRHPPHHVVDDLEDGHERGDVLATTTRLPSARQSHRRREVPPRHRGQQGRRMTNLRTPDLTIAPVPKTILPALGAGTDRYVSASDACVPGRGVEIVAASRV